MIRQDVRSTKRGSKSEQLVRPPLRKPRERLAWLLGFANRAGSIRSLSDEELQQLRLQVLAFCERRMTSGSIATLSAARLAKLSGGVAHGIRALMRREPWLSHIGPMMLYLDCNGGRSIRQYIAEHTDGFLMEAHELIAAEAKRLRHCLRSDCGKIFVANKRQVFCSSSCSQEERTERFLAKHSERELSERRHARYVALIEKTKGPAVANKIRRRQADRASVGK